MAKVVTPTAMYPKSEIGGATSVDWTLLRKVFEIKVYEWAKTWKGEGLEKGLSVEAVVH